MYPPCPESVFVHVFVDKWNGLPNGYMEYTTLNYFKTKIKSQLEPETQI